VISIFLPKIIKPVVCCHDIGTPVNSKYWEAQPCLSADGNTLYFISNRPGGKGKMDIWKSSWNDKGYWNKPVNLGDTINTSGDEMSPYVHPDNQTLYFSSDGFPGMGGFDLFRVQKQDDGTWNKPENLGYPINTHGDEIGLIVNAKGDKALTILMRAFNHSSQRMTLLYIGIEQEGLDKLLHRS